MSKIVQYYYCWIFFLQLQFCFARHIQYICMDKARTCNRRCSYIFGNPYILYKVK